MPGLGLGVYMMKPGEETANAVQWALDAGYRMIDTARIYQNEEDVGRVIRNSDIPRREIFLETKVWDDAHGFSKTVGAAHQALYRLQATYIDLLIIHSPNTGKIVETYDGLLDAQKDGIVKHIGVSNFGIKHLEALEKHGRPLPVVNQIELHPLNYKARKDLVDWCTKRGIVVQAYGSMFFGKQDQLADSRIATIAAAHGKTASQVLLRWAIQMGFQVIPKSTKQARIQENMQVYDFALTDAEMEVLGTMEGELGAYWQPLDADVDIGDTSHWSPSKDEL